MGQYFHVVNIDKKVSIAPHDLGQPTKLTEHSFVGNPLMNHVAALLATHWKGDRVVWAGDYADPEDETFHDDSASGNLYQTDYPQEKRLPQLYEEVVLFANHDKNEYFTLDNLPVCSYGLIIHPLSILVATSNGQGGGDYFGPNKEMAGRWKGDRIKAYSNRKEFEIKKAVSLKEWTKLKTDFVEK